MSTPASYTITAAPNSPTDTVVVADNRGRTLRIHSEDADPEHRFTAYRIAAGWFANLPTGFDPEQVS